MTDPLERARREAAELMGLHPDKLSPGDRLRCELISALRSVVDDELGKVDRANAADLGRLIVAIETLTKFLADAKPKDNEQHAIFRRDPRKALAEMVSRWVAADEAERAEKGLSPRIHDEEAQQRRIDELEAELVRLRGAQPHAQPHALPASAPESERAIDPPTSDIVPPGEQTDRASNLYRGAPRPPPGYDPIINGLWRPPEPDDVSRLHTVLNSDNDEPWRDYVRSDGSISTYPLGSTRRDWSR